MPVLVLCCFFFCKKLLNIYRLVSVSVLIPAMCTGIHTMSKLEHTKKFRMNKLARSKKSWEMSSRSKELLLLFLYLMANGTDVVQTAQCSLKRVVASVFQ